MKIYQVAMLLVALLSLSPAAFAQQNVDPLTGSWKGDWGPSPTDRNTVTVELKWDGKTLTGTVNPGPDAVVLENASFDPKTMKLHLEANYKPRSLRYVVDGTVEKDKIGGTWNRPGRNGDFQLSRQEQKAQSEIVPIPNLAGLNANEKRVVEYLLREWDDEYTLTSVDTATELLGLQPSDEMRFRIGSYLKKHPELHSTIRQWGWETVTLTRNEKLVARAIVNAQRDKRKAPAAADLAKSVRISENEAQSAVRILARYGILKRDNSVGGVRLVAAAPRYLNWQPWLDFQFHRLTLSSGRIFNTN
jgi:hypothetical protein